jgi:hypothetical protein
MSIRNNCFEAAQFFRKMDRIYEINREGNPILTGVKLNDDNKNTAVNYSIALIRIILKT